MTAIRMLDKVAPEEGEYVIVFTFKSGITKTLIEASNITSLKWWLTDLNGTAINGRNEITVSNITNPLYLLLSGNDLQMGVVKTDYDIRVVTLKGLYNSSLGNDIPISHAVMFKVGNLLVIAKPLYIDVTDVIYSGDVIYV